ncbi:MULTISPECIES: hypothetical protein [unclassified Sinorhizobium]|uniref:hypothetical protein n=1 Tax=unclassified Sinorhizobium TaxID=2613772 RepID=UPI0024C2D620|nr:MULTISPECIES: hypothetical protein [unclassified Sinorhizobium]MDK1378680.1 hypothetical protein [Sinorhizobium sp. 6-70]MDK1480748.1 hypothetical protein [Sinorhizobium sp. 6-117]
MRSLITTSAIAALALSLVAGNAFAAGQHHGSAPSSGPENGDYYQGVFPDDGAMTPPAPAVQTTIPAASVREPRLANILHELRSADRRIKSERSEGKLSSVAFNRLHREERNIRAEATGVAATHHGMIPTRSYARLQQDVRWLDRNIARSA